MKNILINFPSVLFLLLLLLTGACQEEDQTFGDIVAPTNLTIGVEIVGQDTDNAAGDGSGLVRFTASADNAISYRYNFGDNTGEILAPGGDNLHRFTQNGLNTYTVTLIASGRGGVSSSITTTVEVFSDFNPVEIKANLTGGLSSSRTWYWNAALPAHLGVGPLDSSDPSFYAAAPFEKESIGCLYEDIMIFSQDADGNVTYELQNQGSTYFNVGEVLSELGLPAPGEDTCYDYDTAGIKNVSFAPSSSGIEMPISTQTSFTIQNRGFMSYFVGSNEYEILSISDTEMHVRVIQTDDGGGQIAWYHKFTTVFPDGDGGDPPVLIWSDEFDVDGAPNASNWSYDLGTGDNGWGNNEQQYYTDRPENIVVENGFLNITAKREPFSGSQFTSARILSKDKFEFTFGKVQVRAKLPTGGGTWPAAWMLGADFETNPWPAAGEIDFMEHVGNSQNTIFSSLHYPGNFGGNAATQSTVVPGVSDGFFIYQVEWTATQIIFSVGVNEDSLVEYHTFANNPNLPFDKDFFLILNQAMGGNFGGTIDPNFNESTYQIDYVRVYQ